MRSRPLTACLAAAVLSATTPSFAAGIQIPFEREQLKNGMTVILHEDHALPIVVVDITYNVGSRYEAARRTGFAHLFEHLMFMGTDRAPTKKFDAWMEASGGWNNAGTDEDRTEYYDVGPSTILPLVLWLEADRLRDLGPLMNETKLNAQREVVRNERRQRSENEPYGKVELRLPELLYPENHPYHHPVIGSHEDLEAATVPDVKEFFAKWYDPANASLVVAGDFSSKDALTRIRRYFESIPSRGAPKDPGAPGFEPGVTTLKQTVRETIEDEVELPKVVMAWQSPKHFGPGDAELDLLSNALASGKASRLYQALVYDQKLAQSVDASQQSGVLGSRFVVDVIARPGVSLDKLEAAIDAELAKVTKEKLREPELTRAKNTVEAAFVARLQTVRGRAAILNEYQTELGDPGYAEKDIERYRRATLDSVQAVAQRTLSPSARVVLRVVPKAKPPQGGNAKAGANGADAKGDRK